MNQSEDDACDQLLRQHQSLTTPLASRVAYSEPIERAITECRLVQVFLIDARQRRARSEYEESKEHLPALHLVFWQQLFPLLNGEALRSLRWAVDLRAYLERCGLDTFEGIGRRLVYEDELRQILQWRTRRPRGAFRLAVATDSATRAILEWRRAK